MDSMQKYMLLDSQQEVIRRRLSLQLPSTTPMTATSSELPSLSPASSRSSYASTWSPEPEYALGQPMPSYPISTLPSTSMQRNPSKAHTDDSTKLCEINKQMKATLTDLLNTESVR